MHRFKVEKRSSPDNMEISPLEKQFDFVADTNESLDSGRRFQTDRLGSYHHVSPYSSRQWYIPLTARGNHRHSLDSHEEEIESKPVMTSFTISSILGSHSERDVISPASVHQRYPRENPLLRQKHSSALRETVKQARLKRQYLHQVTVEERDQARVTPHKGIYMYMYMHNEFIK